MAQYMIVSNFRGATLAFDDYETEGMDRAWAEICSECLDRYKKRFGLMAGDPGDAIGCCSVYGCTNEATTYVDFEELVGFCDKPKVQFVTKDSVPAPEDHKYIENLTAAELARYLYDHAEYGKYISFYEPADDNDGYRWTNEQLVTKIDLAGTDFIVMDSRCGGNHHIYIMDDCSSRQEFVDDMESFVYGNDQFSGDTYTVSAVPVTIPGLEDKLGTEELNRKFWPDPEKFEKSNLTEVSCVAFAEYLAAQEGIRSLHGNYFDFQKSTEDYDHWRVTAMKIGNSRIFAAAGDGEAFNYDPYYDKGDGSGFVAAFMDFLEGCDFEKVYLSREDASAVQAFYEANHNGDLGMEEFLEYVNDQFILDATTYRLIMNLLNYSATFADKEKRVQFLRDTFCGTGITLSDSELKRFDPNK